jgi:hypothetical protein
MSKFEVQEYTLCDGWVNTWSDDEGATTFNSEEEAQAELDWFLHDILQEVEAANMADVSDKDPFRFLEVEL